MAANDSISWIDHNVVNQSPMDWHSHLLLLRILPQQITLYLCFLFIEVCLCGRFLEVGLLGQRANKRVVSSDKAKFSSGGAAPFSPPPSNIGEGCFSIALPMECLLNFCQLHRGKYLRRAALFSLMGVAELVHHQDFHGGRERKQAATWHLPEGAERGLFTGLLLLLPEQPRAI